MRRSFVRIPVSTDWRPYVPTTGGFGTVSTVEAIWRREGPDCLVMVNFTAGTVAASTALVGLPYAPTQIVIANTSLIPSIKLCGTLTKGGGATTNVGYTVLALAGQGSLRIGRLDGTNTGLTALNGNDVFNNGDTLSIVARVPIAGWTAHR